MSLEPYDQFDGNPHGIRYRPEPFPLAERIAPAIRQIERYDELRGRLESQGGSVKDLISITNLLGESFNLQGYFREHVVSLNNPKEMSAALRDISRDLHKQVRRLPHTGMPVYYLCRTHDDIWGTHRLVVEDYYMSPGYPLTTDRFVQLMAYNGHEQFELRLSPLRDGTDGLLEARTGYSSSGRVDRLLGRVGRHVFRAAWHEDQRAGILVADHLGVPAFRHIIELLYLILSADLCALREEVSLDQRLMLGFFEEVYPQPVIHEFFRTLTAVDGQTLTDLPRQALELYKRLGRHFKRFLQQEVQWGEQSTPIPLYKLLLANLSRWEIVCEILRESTIVGEALADLDATSKAIARELLAGDH